MRHKGWLWLPIVVGALLFYRLLNWLHPQTIHITEKGEGSLTIDLPRWFRFVNAMPSAIRLCVVHGRGWIPKKLRHEGTWLKPGGQMKVFFPVESWYDIEVYGMDGQKLEQMKLRVAISFYAD